MSPDGLLSPIVSSLLGAGTLLRVLLFLNMPICPASKSTDGMRLVGPLTESLRAFGLLTVKIWPLPLLY